jgi:hypothetical protein
MAALRATITSDRKGRGASRLGNEWIKTSTDTWKTFVDVTIGKDGSGMIELRRKNQQALLVNFPPEEAKDQKIQIKIPKEK